MSRDELRAWLPERIERGAFVCADGTAIGLVGGGAIAADLTPREHVAAAAREYHGVLLAQGQPLHIYVVDQPLSLDAELRALLSRQAQEPHALLRAILGELADRMADAALHRTPRSKQTIWAISVPPPVTRALPSLARRGTGKAGSNASAALREATDRARRLADALGALGGHPLPRLLEIHEIMLLWLWLADPIRAQRYPLSGDPLARMHRVVAAGAV